MELYHGFLNWLANYAIAISTGVSFLLTVFICFSNAKLSVKKKIVCFVCILTILLSAPYYIILFYYPFVLIPTVNTLFSFSMLTSRKDINVRAYSTLIYIINCFTYAIAIQFAKANFNTWGSGTIYIGVYMIALSLPLFHLLRFIYQQEKFYGILKLSMGSLLLLIIWLSHFPPERDLREVNTTLDLIRNSIVFSVIITVLEGFIMIFQNKITALLKRIIIGQHEV
jgi:hypothetical protein